MNQVLKTSFIIPESTYVNPLSGYKYTIKEYQI